MNFKQIINEFNKKNPKIYLLNGNDIFLINEYKKLIKRYFNINEYVDIEIINNTLDWENISFICLNNNLFMNIKILFLNFKNNIINNKIFKNIFKLFKKFYEKIIIVIIGLYLSELSEKFLIKNNMYNYIININCKKNIFKKMLNYYIKKMKFKFNLNSINLIFNSFNGNFIELLQFLELLLLLYPNGYISINNVKKIIYNAYCFTLSKFIESFLIGNINNSLNILKKIRIEKIEPVLLIYAIQNELMVIIKMKFYKNNKILYKNLNIKKIFLRKIILYNNVINRLTYYDIDKIFLTLSKMENLIKTNNNNILFWNEIKILLFLICK
ncbi:MAG: hypothetical protein ACM3Q6_00285 [Enterobacteriaceae bacterium]